VASGAVGRMSLSTGYSNGLNCERWLSVPEQPTSTPINEVKDIAGLVAAIQDETGWEEIGLMVGVNQPACPWCEKPISHQFCGANGRGECQHCGRHFVWMANHTTFGFQWSTMRAATPRKG